MNNIIGYYKIKNADVSNYWFNNTIFIRSKILLLHYLLIDPINVNITDDNLKEILNHKNMFNECSFVDYYIGFRF